MALAILLGAFAAHGLKDQLGAYELQVFEKGVFYQIVHALAILIVSLAAQIFGERSTLLILICKIFLFGIVIFCGSLYLLALTGIKWLGAITPIGGMAFIVGWILLGVAFLRKHVKSV